MERTPVKSDAIKAVGYSNVTSQLEIEFTDGDVYRYDDVSRYEYQQFMHASSLGTYFSRHIKGRKKFRKVRG